MVMGRPTALYNPHPSPKLSSWYRHGRAVLDFFANRNDYQLIFAPHAMLFERRFVLTIDPLRISRPGKLPERIRQARNIHIDLGSEASSDMTYTTAADLYIGDVSSQVTNSCISQAVPVPEFPRRGMAWQSRLRTLEAGPVIDRPEMLAEGVRQALETHASTYLPIQQQMLARTFDISDVPSSERAASALLRLVDRHGRKTT